MVNSEDAALREPGSLVKTDGVRAGTHAVQFYQHDAFLAEMVTRFIAEGLAAGEPAIVIATASHREQIRRGLTASELDLEKALRTGRLVMLDAEETLARFMVGDVPDASRFDAVVGAALRELRGQFGGCCIRAFGEMVDVLWQRGKRDAAIRLEEMWNALAGDIPFALLCAYRLTSFGSAEDASGFERVCGVHGRVRPAETYAATDDEAAQRQIALLQQRALSLESEIERRKAVEVSLLSALAERDRAEQALRATEAELRDFVENAVEGMHWVDANGIITWANRAELELLGYERDEYVGRPIAEFHTDQDLITDILSRLRCDETLRDCEATLRCKDGSIRHVLITCNVYWKDGQFVHTRCFTRDITARKRAEEGLLLAQRERTESLERERIARVEAEAANRAKDEFLAMLGHELRNPLAPIVTAVQLARMQGRATPELAVIDRHLEHVIRLVDDLLDISRITRGSVEIAHQRLDLAAIVARAIEMSASIIEKRQQRLHVDVPESKCEVIGDPARLAQVVSNLLVNAAKYSDTRTTITVTVRRDRDRIVLSVQDEGIGISAEMLGKVFEPFVQQPQAKDRARGGLGLGLAIVRSLVELHDGVVTAESAGPGRGSTFRVELPAAAPVPAADGIDAQARTPGGPGAPQSHRILVVDDNEDAAHILADVLAAMGHETRIAHDGPSAIETARAFKPSVALLDIGLPEMDGYELAGHLRAEPWARRVRLIALTGYGQPQDRERSRAAGFTEHVVKPVRLETLHELLAPRGQAGSGA